MSRPVSVIRAVGALALLLSIVAELFVASPTLVSAATLNASATSVEAGGVVTLTGTIEVQGSTTYAFYQYSGADCEPGSMVLPAIADGAVVDGAALYTTDVLLAVEGTVSFVFQASDGVAVTETSACVTITVTPAVVIPSPTPEGTLEITKVDQFMSPIPRPAVFRVIEIDEETRVLPPGIEFELGELLNSDAVVGDFVVESTRLITLPVGIYLVTEREAPDGCQPSADTPIVIVLEDDISEAIFMNDCAEPDGSPSPIASPTASPTAAPVLGEGLLVLNTLFCDVPGKGAEIEILGPEYPLSLGDGLEATADKPYADNCDEVEASFFIAPFGDADAAVVVVDGNANGVIVVELPATLDDDGEPVAEEHLLAFIYQDKRYETGFEIGDGAVTSIVVILYPGEDKPGETPTPSPSPTSAPTASPRPGNDDDDNGDGAGADTGDVTQLPETGVGVAASASATTRAAEASAMLMLTMMLLGAGAASWKRSALSRQPSTNR